MRRKRRQLPVLLLAPAVVVIVGLAAALAVGLLGVWHLRQQSDAAAELRSRALALTLAERLRATPEGDRPAVLERAARRSGAELLLVRQNGRIEVDAGLHPPSREKLVELLVQGEGETFTGLGRTRFFAAPLGEPLPHLSVVSFVRAPEKPFATGSLVTSVSALAAVLIGAAALVAFAFARDVHNDVTYVRSRIVEMANEGADPTGKPIAVRSVDQVGLLTSAFNVLVDRFAAAEQAYRQDLTQALAYDRDRSAFLAALSHELRTPLNAILGFTDVLLSGVEGELSDDARESLSVVRNSGQHLRSLIADVLDLSALESGQLELERSEVDVFGVAQEVVREARITAKAKPLVVELQGKPAIAWADARRVRQVLSNVIGNAVKFTSEGAVRVRVDERGRFVAVTVSDTGPGIATDAQAAIFEEYQQTGDANVSRIGTGLGLAITRRLVQMHGGFVELDSELGQGSRFTVVLPAEPEGETRSSAPPPATPALDHAVEGAE